MRNLSFDSYINELVYELKNDTYNGRPRRTRHSHPYSYDPFVIWGAENPKSHCVYTDRLRQWDAEKHAALCKKHFGDKDPANRLRFDFEPQAVEAYLSDYMSKPVTLTCIMQHCNWATGYPLWTFHYQTKDAEKAP